MNKEDIKARLREIFEMTKKVKFFDAKVQDGTILRVEEDSLKEGVKVTLVTKDGAVSQPQDGPYTLEDGTVIEVKGGVVDKITAATAPAADPTADATAQNSMDAVKPYTEELPKEKMDDAAAAAPAAVIAPEAPAMDSNGGMDWGMITEIITNLSDRVAALEAALGDAQMAKEKMNSEKVEEKKNIELSSARPAYEKGQKIDDYLAQVREYNRNKAHQFSNVNSGKSVEKAGLKFNFGSIKGNFSAGSGN